MTKLLDGAMCLASLLAASTLLAQGTTYQNTQALLHPTNVKDSPDVLHYGTSSGQTANPDSRVQIFGFPVPGATIELQVVDARPNVSATFYVGLAHDDQQVPGLGRLLVDLNGAYSFQTTTDAQGRATVSVPIPSGTQSGDEFFVQCVTVDSGPSSETELSSAAYFQVGGAKKPIGALSLLNGIITVTDDGIATSSTTLSGVYSLEWRNGGPTTSPGTVAIHTETSSITVNGFVIDDLRVQPGVNTNEIAWQSGDFLVVPPGTPEDYLVSYVHQGIEYGPYVVSGTYGSQGGDVDVALGAIPSVDGGPLDGATIDLDLTEIFVEPDYFTEIENTGLAESSSSAASAVTPGDVGERFARTENLIREVLIARDRDVGFYDSKMPTYEDFFALESQMLLAFTDGRAGNAQEIQALIVANEMSLDDGWGAIVASKLLAALGISEGWQGFQEVFIEECGDLLDELGKQIDAGEYKKAAKTLGKILDKVTSKKFAKKLADKIGKKLAGKILAKVGSKFIPVVGWAWFALSLLWAIIEQWFE